RDGGGPRRAVQVHVLGGDRPGVLRRGHQARVRIIHRRTEGRQKNGQEGQQVGPVGGGARGVQGGGRVRVRRGDRRQDRRGRQERRGLGGGREGRSGPGREEAGGQGRAGAVRGRAEGQQGEDRLRQERLEVPRQA